MKITRDRIKIMARHVWSGHRLVHDHELVHPGRDWLLGIGSGVVISSIIIGWSAQLYFTYRDNPQDNSDQAQTDMVIYRAPLVESARIILLERGLAAAALKTQASDTVTPVAVPVEVATSTVPEVSEEAVPTATTTESSETNAAELRFD